LRGDEDYGIESASFVYNKLIVVHLHQGVNKLRVYNLESHDAITNMLHEVPLPGRGSIEDETSGDDNENFYLFSYQTYTRPPEFYRLDLDNFNLEKIYDNHLLT